jgi:hypothetical protein
MTNPATGRGELPLDSWHESSARGTVIPRTWPEDRFDLIWTFTLLTKGGYSFAQIPQMLLSGDTDTIIPAG